MQKKVSCRFFKNWNTWNLDKKSRNNYCGHPYSDEIFPGFQIRLLSFIAVKYTKKEPFYYEHFVKYLISEV